MKHGLTWALMLVITLWLAVCTGCDSSATNLDSGGPRFTVSSEGVVTDSKTGLEWVVGASRVIYSKAEEWVAACDVAGGGWRMPTRKELSALYQKGAGEFNMDPAFKVTGSGNTGPLAFFVWAEPRDSSAAWNFDFEHGYEHWNTRWDVYDLHVFGVRSRQR